MGLQCCNPVSRMVLGIIPTSDPSPPIPSNIWFAEIPYDGGFHQLVAPGTLGVNYDLPPAVATFLQTEVMPTSGAAFGASSSSIGFWILSDTEPVGWTINGEDVAWFDGGITPGIKCYQTATFTFTLGEPDSNQWYIFSFSTAIGNSETNDGGANVYDSGGFPAFLLTIVTQIFGVGATGTAVVNPTDVQITISNTYLPVTQNNSLSLTNDPQINNYSEIPCP